MSQLTDRLRYVNRVVGAFLLVIFLLLLLGLFIWTGSRRGAWFATETDVDVLLRPENRNGIHKGTEVFYKGNHVGEVLSIEWPDAGTDLNLKLRVSQEVMNEIKKNGETAYSEYVVMLRYRLAGVGEPYLDLTRDDPDQDWAKEGAEKFMVVEEPSSQKVMTDNATQVAGDFTKVQADFAKMQKDFELMRREMQSLQITLSENAILTRQQIEKMAANTDELRASAVINFEKFGQGSETMGQSTQSMEAQFSQTNIQLQATLEELKIHFEKFGTGSEQLGDSSVKMEEQFRQTNVQLRKLLADLQAVTPQLSPLLAQTQQVMNNMREVTDVLQKESENLPGTVKQTRNTLDETQALIQAIQENPLIKSHTGRGNNTPIISPSRVGP